MPFAIEDDDGGFRVVNKETGQVHAKHTTRAKAEAQVRLLRGIEHHGVIPHEASDKGRFVGVEPHEPESLAVGREIMRVKGYGRIGQGIASRAAHTKQERLREVGAAPSPVDKVGPK